MKIENDIITIKYPIRIWKNSITIPISDLKEIKSTGGRLASLTFYTFSKRGKYVILYHRNTETKMILQSFKDKGVKVRILGVDKDLFKLE